MGDVQAVYKNYITQIKQQGTLALSNQFPDEFEYYAFAFELVDSQDNTIQMFVFPVNPNILSLTDLFGTNITTTAGGVVSLTRDAFTPFPINLSGNFGRKFRTIVNNNNVDAVAFNLYPESGTVRVLTEFDPQVKTGYGAIKILQNILKQSVQLDGYGFPYRLFFYNLAFNSNYMVEVMSAEYQTNQESSRIWNYNISLKAIAPATSVRKTTPASDPRKIGSIKAFEISRAQLSDQTDYVLNQKIDEQPQSISQLKSIYNTVVAVGGSVLSLAGQTLNSVQNSVSYYNFGSQQISQFSDPIKCFI